MVTSKFPTMHVSMHGGLDTIRPLLFLSEYSNMHFQTSVNTIKLRCQAPTENKFPMDITHFYYNNSIVFISTHTKTGTPLIVWSIKGNPWAWLALRQRGKLPTCFCCACVMACACTQSFMVSYIGITGRLEDKCQCIHACIQVQSVCSCRNKREGSSHACFNLSHLCSGQPTLHCGSSHALPFIYVATEASYLLSARGR